MLVLWPASTVGAWVGPEAGFFLVETKRDIFASPVN
jgi:hypothetical protein